jgi:hypothetical protein
VGFLLIGAGFSFEAAVPEKVTEDASKADKQGNFVNSDKNYRSFVDEQPSDA